MAKKYNRVLLKLSGEALADDSGSGVSGKVLKALGQDIAAVAKSGVQVAVVVGAGNIWRYRDNADLPIERSASDQMGMLAGVINAVALQNAIEHAGVDSRVQSALTMPQVAESYIRRRAIRHLDKGRVVIFAAGVGQPYFTHDTAGALRALEINADVLLKGSNVDGVYDSDPDTNPKAKRFETVSYDEVLTKDLKVMDATAISLCRENKLPIVVFDLFAKDALKKAVSGAKIGTKVST